LLFSTALAACAASDGRSGDSASQADSASKADSAQLRVMTDSLARMRARYVRGDWLMRRDTSPMDGSVLVTAATLADSIQTRHGMVTPALMLRCGNSKTNLVATTQAYVDAYDHEVAVRIRIDSLRPERQTWNESTTHEAIFARQPIAFVRRLVRAKQLRIEYPTLTSGTLVARFSLHGLDPAAAEVAAHCGWKL
jgi:hypothetical protein